MHYPGYEYLGPMTGVFKRAGRPVNWLDLIAKQHDEAYAKIIQESGNASDAYLKFNKADKEMIKKMWKMKNYIGRKGPNDQFAVQQREYDMVLSIWKMKKKLFPEKPLRDALDEWFHEVGTKRGGDQQTLPPPKVSKPGRDPDDKYGDKGGYWYYPAYPGMDDTGGYWIGGPPPGTLPPNIPDPSEAPPDPIEAPPENMVVNRWENHEDIEVHWICEPNQKPRALADIWPKKDIHYKLS